MILSEIITVVIPTSPIPSHPFTEIIDETIASVRSHLPDVKIIVMADGVRSEQEHLKTVYQKYISDLLRKNYPNVSVRIFPEFNHQASMMKRTMEKIETPQMLYVEHDTPLCEGKEIDWQGMIADIVSGDVNSIRLHHYDLGYIHPEHEYLMLPKRKFNVEVIPTVQWSQRPHLTTTQFYNRVLSYFSSESRTMIEDKMYEVIMGEVARNGKEATWESWRLSIYSPEGHIKRSRDLNGRAGGPKFEGTFHA